MTEAVYELKDVWKVYGSGKNAVAALRGVNLVVRSGEFVAVMGPSGSGKSALLMVLGLMTSPTEGVVRLFGREVSRSSESKLDVESSTELLKPETVNEVVLTIKNLGDVPAEDAEVAVELGQWLTLIGPSRVSVGLIPRAARPG
ncbi:MAG TPA: ATP-binding cassette domain-containing protein [Candidatus Korarchaeota archaeon]|nr:ATP-binding cassette domain-containing protein [Candidatus Korarchaeota archaeon]